MKAPSKAASGGKNIQRVHRDLVDKIASAPRPVGLVLRPGAQWVLWLFLSLTVAVAFLLNIGLQSNASQVLTQMPPLAFLTTAFLGACLAAWEAIASSVPGRQTGKAYRVFSFLALAALLSIPFLFFRNPAGGLDLIQAFRDGNECAGKVSLSGLLPWIALGWMLSRNASFNPIWTGAWAGTSSFLMGVLTVQIHCPGWQMDHMVAAHLLPAAAMTFLATFAGAFWFSRWKK